MHNRLIPVTSSNIKAVAFDDLKECLYVVFKNRRQYRYDNVPSSLWEQLLVAGSKGGFFNRSIRDKFSATELTIHVLNEELDALPGAATEKKKASKPKARKLATLSNGMLAQYPFLRMV